MLLRLNLLDLFPEQARKMTADSSLDVVRQWLLLKEAGAFDELRNKRVFYEPATGFSYIRKFLPSSTNAKSIQVLSPCLGEAEDRFVYWRLYNFTHQKWLQSKKRL